jgi:GntR family transcriptional repressor for pyruvate dehydrogenase complex
VSATTAEETRSEGIARQLRREILDGRWRPGERLPAERELASQLGVHRSSVREALRKLEELRLVVIRRGDGARVRPIESAGIEIVRDLLLRDGRIDPVVAQQIVDVREMLITGAARLALERGAPRRSIALARSCSDSPIRSSRPPSSYPRRKRSSM